MKMFDLFKKKRDSENNNVQLIKYCTCCGKSMNISDKFCSSCGKYFDQTKKLCPKCSNYINKEYNFCPMCGFSFLNDNAIEEEKLEIIENKDEKEANVVEIKNEFHPSKFDKKENFIIKEKETEKELVNTSMAISESVSEINNKNKPEDKKLDFIDAILQFVEDNKNPAVYYSVIYGKFKTDCEMLNINKISELKSNIDRYLDNNLFKNDKFISIYNNEKEIKDCLVDVISSLDFTFSIYDVWKKAPGIQWPILESILRDLKNQKKIIAVENSPIIKYRWNKNEDCEINNAIAKKDIQEVKIITEKNKTYNDELFNFVIDVLQKIDCEMVSAKIVYAQLRLFKEELFNSINEINEYDKFCEYIRKEFEGRLYINKPFISNKPIRSATDVTCDYLKTLEGFDKNTIDEFDAKIGLESHKGYDIYLNKMSEEFVQIDETMMVKKDIFNISSDLLRRITRNLDIYFKNEEVLNTKTFKSYFTFPKLEGYEWNKHLLIGIIRSYLNEKYIITKIGKNVFDMDYEVRSGNNDKTNRN